MSTTTDSQIAAYLRVAAYSIALFEVIGYDSLLQSMPSEYRLYAKQKGPFSLSVACILFILVRYLGITAMLMGGVGFFYHGFSPESCAKFYWLAPVFKRDPGPSDIRGIAEVADDIAGTYYLVRLLRPGRVHFNVLEASSLSTRRTYCPFHVLIAGAETRFALYQGNCTGGNLPGVKVASLYYVGCLVFDVVAMTITGVYLWKFSNNSRASLSRLAQMMLEDGIMYFVALTAMNIVNLIFFQNASSTLQSSASSLGFAATMIFSSRFILNLSERSRDGISGDTSHSSRTPVSGGRRGPNHTLAGTQSEIVVNVKKNVITMHDMVPGQDVDDESASQVKGGEWAREDGSMA
ncbi:hypothetical protein C8R46DRAFT_1029206 [Mycena filopes]|nr:hypothetical protein C8R46DRAFT_1029206 [Mycena filopes]